jgi:hypothetical protein
MKDQVVTELVYGKVILVKDDSPYLIFNNDYKRQLKDLLHECPTLNVDNADYSAKSLIKLLKSYHSYCKVDYHVLFENDDRVKTSVGFSSESYFPQGYDPIYSFSFAVRFLLPKRFNNRFVFVEVRRIANSSGVPLFAQDHISTQFGLYGGTYFGKGKSNFLPLVYGGFAYPLNAHIGAGISFRKRLDLSVLTQITKDPVVGVSVRLFPFIPKK